jgi:hypothetical protein
LLLLVGAGLGILSNLLHPVFSPDVPLSEFLTTAAQRADWTAMHLALFVGLMSLTSGLVLVTVWLQGTRGAAWAVAGAVLAVVGLGISAVQIGVLDAIVVPQLKELDPQAGAVTELVALLDRALLAMTTFASWGLGTLAFGLALLRADTARPWVRWTFVGSGVAAAVVGLMMLLEVADAFTFVAFRVAALGETVGVIGLALWLRRGVDAPLPD